MGIENNIREEFLKQQLTLKRNDCKKFNKKLSLIKSFEKFYDAVGVLIYVWIILSLAKVITFNMS